MRVITGTARGTVLKTPAGMQTRPTAERVKEALFSALHYDLPGMHVLDLFAGTGQLGIEALSRGAVHCVFVDARPDAAALVQENLRRAKLGIRRPGRPVGRLRVFVRLPRKIRLDSPRSALCRPNSGKCADSHIGN